MLQKKIDDVIYGQYVPNLSELLEAMMPTMASARVNLPRDNSHLTDSGTILKVKIQFKIRA